MFRGRKCEDVKAVVAYRHQVDLEMNHHQTELLEFLRNSEPTAAAKVLLKRTSQQFVLDYGWWFEPVTLPEGICCGAEQECHKNATELASDTGSLIYCEGFAKFQDGSMPVLHAWITDGHGRAIDNTWRVPGVAYAGVPFKTNFVITTALANHATISLLDDWQNDYPLRRELGDRPDEWFEYSGRV